MVYQSRRFAQPQSTYKRTPSAGRAGPGKPFAAAGGGVYHRDSTGRRRGTAAAVLRTNIAGRVSMGEQNVEQQSDEASRRAFMKALLNEVRAMEEMHTAGLFENDIRRIGAEQEMFLVDKAYRPAMTSMQLLEHLDDPRFTHELGLFNLEANLSPLELGGDCLRKLEAETEEVVELAREHAASSGPVTTWATL